MANNNIIITAPNTISGATNHDIGRIKALAYVQINVQHSKVGTASLCRTLGKLRTYTCLIQEPYVVRSTICGLNDCGNMYSFGGGREPPRACLITSVNLKCSQLLEFCDRDVAAVAISFTNGPVVMASVYMDYNGICPPPKMQQLVAFCASKGLPLVLGCDANAHHTLWGSTNINDRGEVLLDYLARTNMHVINRGHRPTFVVKNRKEVLDVTLVSTSLVASCNRWWVDEEESSSDHRYIRAQFNLGLPEPIYGRNRRKANWVLYASVLRKELSVGSVPIESTDEIDSRVEKLTRVIKEAFEAFCPLRKIRPKGKQVPWWSKELTSLRRTCRRLYRAALGSDLGWRSYQAARSEYHLALRRAKRLSWREFCGKVEGCSAVSRLCKVLINDKVVKLGALQKDDGTYTRSLEESYEMLLEQHFPADPTRTLPEKIHFKSDRRSAVTIVTEVAVVRAITSFSPFKSAGPDEIFPALLQKGTEYIVPCLTPIFRACIQFGYMPEIWRRMRVVFIPKPGKDSYERASSWRPISLTSFLLKTLERLIDWYLRSPTLVGRLKNAGQFAYLEGVSTDAALHQVTARIERSLKSGEFALCAFLDIKGAFSDAPFRTLIRGLGRNDVDVDCVRFISHMLTTRTVEASVSGTTLSRLVERGCPQGGVLSPLLWNLVVDEILVILSNRMPQIYSQGYADDLVCLGRGKVLSIVSEHVRDCLSIVSDWCREIGLSINEKSALMLFTHRKKFRLSPIHLVDQVLAYCDTVRYLGVTFDPKLTWSAHCRVKATKSIVAMAQCRRAIGPVWGLSPKTCKWIYEAVVRPAVEYSAVVWAAASYSKTKIALLQKAQRNALLNICGGMRSTPTAAMECMVGMLPIHLRLQEVAMLAYHRLLRRGQWLGWQGVGYTQMKTHIDWCTSQVKEIVELQFPFDHLYHYLPSERNFSVRIVSRREWSDTYSELLKGVGPSVYTDGSRLNSTSSGSAFSLWVREQAVVGAEGLIPLGRYPTVFQAELMGVIEATLWLPHNTPVGCTINFFVDSSSVLKALTSNHKVCGLVLEAFKALQKLSEERKVILNWIPAHCGHLGNEYVDVRAKQAAEMPFVGPEPSIAASLCVAREAIKTWARRKHGSWWRSLDQCRQAKQFIMIPYSGPYGKCLRATRGQIRLLTYIITGHSTLNGHLFKMGLVDSPVCTNCTGRVEETVSHFLGYCERYAALRYEIFGAHSLGLEELIERPLPELVKYLVNSGRFTSWDLARNEAVSSQQ